MPRANIQQLRAVPLACPEPAEGFHRYAQFKSLSETHGSIGSSAARVPDRPGCGRSKVQG